MVVYKLFLFCILGIAWSSQPKKACEAILLIIISCTFTSNRNLCPPITVAESLCQPIRKQRWKPCLLAVAAYTNFHQSQWLKICADQSENSVENLSAGAFFSPRVSCPRARLMTSLWRWTWATTHKSSPQPRQRAERTQSPIILVECLSSLKKPNLKTQSQIVGGLSSLKRQNLIPSLKS